MKGYAYDFLAIIHAITVIFTLLCGICDGGVAYF